MANRTRLPSGMNLSVLFFLFLTGYVSVAQTKKPNAMMMNSSSEEQEVINLSKDKWQWMADKNVDKLAALFDEKSMFVHMGGTWDKSRELEVIKSGNIWYKNASVYSTTFHLIGNTAILLSDIDLVAVVGGNEVTNPFMVTEVFVHQNGKWSMGQLSFSRLLRPVNTSKP